jgi:hypothetical protein
MELKTDKNKIKYYLIPKGTTLYRADSENKGETLALRDQITFFGFDQENVEENYGITYEFKTNKQLKLLAIDKNNSKEFLDIIKKSNDEVVTILNKNYGYKTGFRDSDAKKDNILSEFICKHFQDYDGYACDEMQTQTGHLHAEVMLCSPANKFQGLGKLVTHTDKIQGLREKHNLIQRGLEMEQQRREARNKNKRTAYQGTNLFGLDDEEESSNLNLYSDHLKGNDDYELPQGKKLFGGKRKTKRKKSKRRKTKKNKF